MKIKHTRESDFKDIESEFCEFHYMLATEIQNLFTDDFSEFSIIPILVDDSGKKLIVLLNDEKYEKYKTSIADNKPTSYKITIEKIIE